MEDREKKNYNDFITLNSAGSWNDALSFSSKGAHGWRKLRSSDQRGKRTESQGPSIIHETPLDFNLRCIRIEHHAALASFLAFFFIVSRAATSLP